MISQVAKARVNILGEAPSGDSAKITISDEARSLKLCTFPLHESLVRETYVYDTIMRTSR